MATSYTDDLREILEEIGDLKIGIDCEDAVELEEALDLAVRLADKALDILFGVIDVADAAIEELRRLT